MFRQCCSDVQPVDNDQVVLDHNSFDESEDIIIDSGANRHMFNTYRFFSHIDLLFEPRVFVSANNIKTYVNRIGDVLWLKDVLYLSSAHNNIISLSCLQSSGFGARLVPEGLEILLPDGQPLLTARLVNGLYYVKWSDMLLAKDIILDHWSKTSFNNPSQIEVPKVMLSMHETIALLHKRLGHVSMSRIKHMINAGYLSSETTLTTHNDHVCDACSLCKSTRSMFRHTFPECTYIFERIHMDVQGPFKVPSLFENNYIVGFIDAFTRMSFTYYVKHKSDVYSVLVNEFFPHAIEFARTAGRVPKDSVITIVSDNGEFKSVRVKEFLSAHGIRQLFTCPYTPEHNGLIERLWRTLHSMASTMMYEKHVLPELWEEAHKTANYLYNRIPPTNVTSYGLISPYQLFYGTGPPNLSHIRMFGSKAFVHRTDPDVGKTFDMKAYEGILVGYDEEHIKSYRVYIPSTKTLVITTHVTIDEEYLKLEDMYPFRQSQAHMTLSSSSATHVADHDSDTKSVTDFDYLVGTHHRDDEDGMIYQTTRVCDENGLIVVYRRLVNKTGRLSRKEDGPLHVYDIERLTQQYEPHEPSIIKNMNVTCLDDIYQDDNSVIAAMAKTTLLSDERVVAQSHQGSDQLDPMNLVYQSPDELDPRDPVSVAIDKGDSAPPSMIEHARDVLTHLVSVLNKRCRTDGTDNAQLEEDTVQSKRRRASGLAGAMPVELTSSDARAAADPRNPSSGNTGKTEGSHDPDRLLGERTLAGKALVINLLDSIYTIPDIRNKLMITKNDHKKYVSSINRQHERAAVTILKRRASQGDVIASLLMDNNQHSDMLARYTSFQSEPMSHDEAMYTPDYEKWDEAEQSEIRSLLRNKVFKIVDKPSNRKLIPCKWIYKRKKSKTGAVEKFKARLVAKGFLQIYGQDFNETFSPVARLTTIRLLYAIATLLNLKVTQLDVETAFLNAELPEEEQVFVEPPRLMELPPGKCYRLQRSLYGLKQSPRLWNMTIDKYLREIGFRRLSTDPCIYVKGTPNSSTPYTVISLYVDDLILLSSEQSTLDKVVKQLGQRFMMKDFGSLEHILGTEVYFDAQSIYVSQRNYATQLLRKHRYLDDPHFTPRRVPMSPAVRLSKSQCPSTDNAINFMAEFDRATTFREILGGLLWLSINTRPDISYAVNQISKFCNNPGPIHWNAMESVLRYIKGTLDWGLRFNIADLTAAQSSELFGLNSSSFNNTDSVINILEPIIASDADFSRDNDTSKSVSGYVFMLAGAPISWHSTTQPTVALSSMESEYIAACSATQEALWLKSVLEELGFGCQKPLIIQEDNKSTIEFADHPCNHRQTKHINRKFHFLREQIKEGNIRLKYCKGSDNIADIFTKPLYPEDFERHRGSLIHKIPVHLFRA